MSTEIINTTMTSSQAPAFRNPYEYGPVHLFGTGYGLYGRHLLYKKVIERTSADACDRFEAFARAVRDILSQRWVSTERPARGYRLRYRYGLIKQSFNDGWQEERPDNWFRRQDPWEVARPREQIDVKLNVSFESRAGERRAISGRSSSLIGILYDRPIAGYGGKTTQVLAAKGELAVSRGNKAPIRGLKLVIPDAWFAARPIGAEVIYKSMSRIFREKRVSIRPSTRLKRLSIMQ